MSNALQAFTAADCASVVLDNLSRSYPYAAHHVQLSPDDNPSPQSLHPAFFTSFDWHSCVHMHWLGVSVLETADDDGGLGAAASGVLREALAANLTADKLDVEAAYLLDNPSWERPYGWAWLMRLAATCSVSEDEQIRGWSEALESCVDAVAELTVKWVEKTEYPVRHGLHSNSAFGVAYLLDAFRVLGRDDAAAACEKAARRWFGSDMDWPGQWELSGQDFLSAGLTEADLMRRVLDPDEFAQWFNAFLPVLEPGSRILQPVSVADETDGHMTHLHGLNLTRSGQLARIVTTLGDGGAPSSAVLESAMDRLAAAGLTGLQSEDFMSSHWLASFAWDARQSMAALHSQ